MTMLLPLIDWNVVASSLRNEAEEYWSRTTDDDNQPLSPESIKQLHNIANIYSGLADALRRGIYAAEHGAENLPPMKRRWRVKGTGMGAAPK